MKEERSKREETHASEPNQLYIAVALASTYGRIASDIIALCADVVSRCIFMHRLFGLALSALSALLKIHSSTNLAVIDEDLESVRGRLLFANFNICQLFSPSIFTDIFSRTHTHRVDRRK